MSLEKFRKTLEKELDFCFGGANTSECAHDGYCKNGFLDGIVNEVRLEITTRCKEIHNAVRKIANKK